MRRNFVHRCYFDSAFIFRKCHQFGGETIVSNNNTNKRNRTTISLSLSFSLSSSKLQSQSNNFYHSYHNYYKNNIICHYSTTTIYFGGSKSNKNSSRQYEERGNTSGNVRVNVSASCPYAVLNIPKDSNYGIAKRAFIQLALIYHPDKTKSNDTTIFVRIRDAFEEICCRCNTTISNDDDNNDTRNYKMKRKYWRTESDFDTWFQEEISSKEYLAFQMDEQTRREVIDAYKNNSGYGNNDKGGYWEMARQIVERDNVRQRIAQQQHHQSSSSGVNNSVVGGLLLTGNESSSSSQQHDPICIRRKRKR